MRASSYGKSLQSCLTLVTSWTVVCQSPLPIRVFSATEGAVTPLLQGPSLRTPPPASSASQADSVLSSHREKPLQVDTNKALSLIGLVSLSEEEEIQRASTLSQSTQRKGHGETQREGGFLSQEESPHPKPALPAP